MSKLALGTVQFGLKYGITNMGGKTSEEEAKRILELAARSGVSLLDTAYAYGTSEETLGKIASSEFEVVTKIPNLKAAADPSRGAESYFAESLKRLKRERVYGLLFHNPDDLALSYAAVSKLREQGRVQKIGISAYNEAQLRDAIAKFDIQLVQVPIHILDQRLVTSGCLRDLKKKGVEIHVRSVFWQGLLLMDPDAVNPFFESTKPALRELRARVKASGKPLLSVLLHYVKSIPEVDRMVVGVNDRAQFEQILKAYDQDGAIDVSGLSLSDEKILNPMKWELR